MFDDKLTGSVACIEPERNGSPPRQPGALARSGERARLTHTRASRFAMVPDTKARNYDNNFVENTEQALDIIGNILESSTEYSIIGKALDGTILLWNEGARRLYGYLPEEVLGRANAAILHTPEDVAAGLNVEICQRALHDGKWEGTVTRVRKNGQRFQARVCLTPRCDMNGKAIGYLLISKDITAEIRLSEELKNNKELEAFSYSISHDLRAPLRAIDGFSRILLEDYLATLPEEAQRYLTLVRDNTHRMSQLVDDLLAFSRLSRQPLILKPVDPGKLVRQCLAEMQTEQQGRQLIIDIADLPLCQADPTLLKQVWINLLSNALKYTSRQEVARITVGARTVPRAAPSADSPSAPACRTETIYFVQDNGAGFDMKYADQLFGVFQRLHRAADFEGTGVGLAIVQRIVQRHGGRVWGEGQVNRGATFSFTLE